MPLSSTLAKPRVHIINEKLNLCMLCGQGGLYSMYADIKRS